MPRRGPRSALPVGLFVLTREGLVQRDLRSDEPQVTLGAGMDRCRESDEWGFRIRLLDRGALAVQLGISARSIRTAVERGDLTPHVIGGKHLFAADDVAAWVRSRRRAPTP